MLFPSMITYVPPNIFETSIIRLQCIELKYGFSQCSSSFGEKFDSLMALYTVIHAQ